MTPKLKRAESVRKQGREIGSERTRYRSERCCEERSIRSDTKSSPGSDSLQAREGTLETVDVEHVALRNGDLVHEDRPRDRSAKRELVLDLRRRQSFPSLRRYSPLASTSSRSENPTPAHLLEHEAANLAIPLALGPNDKDVRDGRVGDPRLRSTDHEASSRCLGRLGHHASGIGAVVRLGESKAADFGARRQVGEELLLKRIASKRVCECTLGQIERAERRGGAY